jgi:hypothetical protein
VIGQGLTSLNVAFYDAKASSPLTQTYSDKLPRIAGPFDTLSVVMPATLFAGGTYMAKVWGTTVDTRLIPGHPSYSFSLVAVPVPEPETYAMMLAGLGMMGFIARRRRPS